MGASHGLIKQMDPFGHQHPITAPLKANNLLKIKVDMTFLLQMWQVTK